MSQWDEDCLEDWSDYWEAKELPPWAEAMVRSNNMDYTREQIERLVDLHLLITK